MALHPTARYHLCLLIRRSLLRLLLRQSATLPGGALHRPAYDSVDLPLYRAPSSPPSEIPRSRGTPFSQPLVAECQPELAPPLVAWSGSLVVVGFTSSPRRPGSDRLVDSRPVSGLVPDLLGCRPESYNGCPMRSPVLGFVYYLPSSE